MSHKTREVLLNIQGKIFHTRIVTLSGSKGSFKDAILPYKQCKTTVHLGKM